MNSSSVPGQPPEVLLELLSEGPELLRDGSAAAVVRLGRAGPAPPAAVDRGLKVG